MKLVELADKNKICNLVFLKVAVKVNFLYFFKSTFFSIEEGKLHGVSTKSVLRRPASDYEAFRSVCRRRLGKKRLILRDLIEKKERRNNTNKKELA